MRLSNQDLEILLPVFCNNNSNNNTSSVTRLFLVGNIIHGQAGGDFLRRLLGGSNNNNNNNTSYRRLKELDLRYNNHIGGPEGGARGLGQGLASPNCCLQILNLHGCDLGNEGLATLVLSMGDSSTTKNHSLLTHLKLGVNRIEDAEGGRQVGLMLQRCFPNLKVLDLENNSLGPLGASTLAPALAVTSAAASSHLEVLKLSRCGLGNEGVGNLVASGETNASLAVLNLHGNHIQGGMGGEALARLVLRCTNVEKLVASSNPLLRSEGVHQLCRGLLQGGQPRRRFRRLDLSHCDVGDHGVQALSESSIFASDNLQQLEIRNNGITWRGLGSITSMLPRCKNMKTLTISYNRDIFNDPPTVEAFSRALSSHPSLLDLDMSQHDMYGWVQSEIVSGIAKSPSLHVVSGNFDPENRLWLDSFLRRNCMLTHVKSLDDKSPSVPTLHLALRKMCCRRRPCAAQGSTAVFVLLQNHGCNLFPGKQTSNAAR